MNKPDISLIITAHNEGRLIHRTLRSAQKAIKYAQTQGIQTEIILIIDSPTEDTSKYISNSKLIKELPTKQLEVRCRDAGLARNHGIKLASGKYISILDGDDLYNENWLACTFNFAEEHKAKAVFHPETEFFFGMIHWIWKRRSSNSRNFNKLNLIHTHYWDSLAFAPKEIFEKVPYIEIRDEHGFGKQEDYYWNCETLAKGFEHIVVPKTFIFVRKKFSGSRLLSSTLRSTISPPTIPKCTLFNKIPVRSKVKIDNSNENITLGRRIKRLIPTKFKETDLYLLAHHAKTSLKKSLQSARNESWFIKRYGKDCLEQIREIAEIEPWIKNTHISKYELYNEVPQANANGVDLTNAYIYLMNMFKGSYTDLIFADNQSSLLIQNVIKGKFKTEVIEVVDAEVINDLVKRFNLPLSTLLMVLERFLLQSPASRIHLSANSLITEVVQKYVNPELTKKEFYLHIMKNKPVDYKTEQIFDIVNTIFVYSEKIQNYLIKKYGLDENRLKVVDKKD